MFSQTCKLFVFCGFVGLSAKKSLVIIINRSREFMYKVLIFSEYSHSTERLVSGVGIIWTLKPSMEVAHDR